MISQSELSLLTDGELVNHYQKGIEPAFEILLRRCKNRVFTTIHIFVRDQYVAEDIFQETFIKVIAELRKGNYNDEGVFTAWVIKIAKNICIDYYRSKNRKPTIVDADGKNIFNVLKFDEPSMEQKLLTEETKTDIRILIDKLPCKMKEILILRQYSKLSFTEISNLTGINMNTCLGLMSRALNELRKMKGVKEILS